MGRERTIYRKLLPRPLGIKGKFLFLEAYKRRTESGLLWYTVQWRADSPDTSWFGISPLPRERLQSNNNNTHKSSLCVCVCYVAASPSRQEINFLRQNGDEYNLPKAAPQQWCGVMSRDIRGSYWICNITNKPASQCYLQPTWWEVKMGSCWM